MKVFPLARVFMLAAMLIVAASCMAEPTDSISPKKERKGLIGFIKKAFHFLSDIDTSYIEPQHYNFAVMLQATQPIDFRTLTTRGDDSREIRLSPKGKLRIGPYGGWRWLFAGYTFDVTQIRITSDVTDINFCLYATPGGIDLFYRRTGTDCKIMKLKLGEGIDTRRLVNQDFGGFKIGSIGFNAYYLFNHERFSYPAAFNQSTCQKVSCGSWMVGLGYTNNTMTFDEQALQKLLASYPETADVASDNRMKFEGVKYHSVSLSGGYAYNWVFAKRWLMGASLQLAMAYKKNYSGLREGSFIRHFNLDAVGRFGVVYNNVRWFAGLSTILYVNNYRQSQFFVNNTFGSINLYIGYNFGLRSKYKKQKKT